MWLEREYGPLGDAPEESGAVPPPAVDDPREYLQCGECGIENEEWDTHCEGCGQPLTSWGWLHDRLVEERWMNEMARRTA